MPDMTKVLQSRVEKVTRQAYEKMREDFRGRRSIIISELRELGFSEVNISKLIGVSTQYLSRVFSRKEQQQ